MALVGSLAIGISAHTQQFQQAMTQVQRTLKQTAGSVTSLDSSVKGLTRTFGALTAGILSIEGLRRGVSDLVDRGRQLELLHAAFTNIAGSAEGGEAMWRRLSNTANALGVSITDLAKSYKGFIASAQGTSLAGDQIETSFQQIVRSTRALGLSSEDTSSIILAFQQIISKGRVAAEEWRGQIGERLPGAMQLGARAMNMTMSEFNRAME